MWTRSKKERKKEYYIQKRMKEKNERERETRFNCKTGAVRKKNETKKD